MRLCGYSAEPVALMGSLPYRYSAPRPRVPTESLSRNTRCFEHWESWLWRALRRLHGASTHPRSRFTACWHSAA